MVSDETYEICLPVLQDSAIEDEDKADKLEELLRKETTLTGQSLDNAVLDVLWRFKEGGGNSASPPVIRQTILRRPSPASFRSTATPLSGSPRLGVSPLAPPGFAPPFSRTLSSAASPFSSPRPSPRLAFSTPAIPHSPNLNAYEFANDTEPSHETFEDYTSDNVDWLVADDAISVASSFGTASGLNAAAPEFSSQQAPMRPHDVLRSILGESRTDEEISQALVENGYDLGAVLMSMMDSQDTPPASSADTNGYLVGKSMTPDARPTTPADQKSGVICKFFLSSGSCMRADCRFSHDLSGHICRYWLAGNCLAGETCIFSHDPAHLMNKLNVEGTSTPPTQKSPANIQVQDYSSFPSLGSLNLDAVPSFTPSVGIAPPPGFKNIPGEPRSRSRPGSRHQQNKEAAAAQAALLLDDNEAFPSLGSASAKQGKKHHGKRGGHGHGTKETYTPSSLADIVKMAPSPGPASRPDSSKKMSRNGSSQGGRNGENSAAAQAIPSPKHIPWLETGEGTNKAYMKARGEAHRHGALRNKFLQNAAQAWNRQDARQAKVFSLRGQSENDLMRRYHREAADKLYEERNKSSSSSNEIYVDLHGLHTEEAVEYLERVLLENEHDNRPVYAITGTGHHSKNGKDKVGKAVRSFLSEWRYAFREFSVPGDRNSMGGILGIDARSYDRSLLKTRRDEPKEAVDILSQGVEIGEGKVKLLVRDTTIGKEPPKGPRGSR
ncbi:hypothetical protein M406DRAFT_347507 [Cryphonectria parasitica EP155]|uniref:CCCH zinc finger and SMR domain-containing protein n=1 Tax=Cryphonectria parasitica (strain ATCC 38755 / EP155) TaxID=660469 RepID=A0A9P4XW86_CRYP1|nr:uncharacterized protein M406DRAFT_347507 [Cryphonectria parasitica EP155]KAF3762429.1 hypothetical protein M406DRAFT_347507 [Cryphonectria parasitica EP155]